MLSQFGAGTLVEYAGSQWRVQRALGVETVLLRALSGEEVAADPLKLRRVAEAEAAAEVVPPLEELRHDEHDWAEATRRRDILGGLARKSSRTGGDIATAATALGLTPRRIWSLLRRIRNQGDEVAHFLPARRGTRAKRLVASSEAVIQQAIDQHYAKGTRPSLQSLVNEVAGRCTAAGLTPPSAKAVKARVRARDQAWLIGRREGSAKARSLRLLTGAHPGAAAPWARVQIDSTPCDIRLVREHERTVIGRPNVTFAIDLYSRVILGFSVSLQSASTVTVATCLAHACLPKQDWLAKRDLIGADWPVWGKPGTLEYDQGPENEAAGIQRGLRLHGIASKVRVKGRPEQHGTIERLIGTMMRRIHERRGTTFSNVNERGTAEPDRLACLSLPELEQIIVLEVDGYNHSVHDGVGDRPLDRYRAYYRRPDLSEDQRVPPILPAGRLLLDFLPYERRRLVRTGFRLFRVDYSSRDLLPMWRQQNQEKIERIVVYDPRSLATVWVADSATSEYMAVPYRVPRPDMTLAESETARSALQSAKLADRTEARLFDNILQVRAIEERGRTATARMKAERSKQARRSALRPPASATENDAPRNHPAIAAIVAPHSIIAFDDVEDL